MSLRETIRFQEWCLESHVEWRRYLLDQAAYKDKNWGNGHAVVDPELKNIAGHVAHHEICMSGYIATLMILRSLEGKLHDSD